MNITEAHQQKIDRINAYVKRTVESGGTDENILEGIYDYMQDFKSLMDELPKGGINFLCNNYDEFHRFSKILELLAEGLQSGKIKV